MSPEEFRRLRPSAHRLARRLPREPGRAAGDGEDEARRGPGRPARRRRPTTPEDFAAVIADLDRVVLPGLSLWQHPRFFGYFPANALPAGVLADLVSTGLGVLGLSWQSSPAVTEIEEVVTDWLRQMLGLSPAFSGVIQDTASTSTLVALICARERATDYALARGGLQGEARTPRVYVSAHAHSSVDKGALLAGFGRDNLRAGSVRRRICDARRRSGRDGRRRRRQRRSSLRHRRDRRHDGDHGDRSGRATSPRWRAPRGSGSTSTRRWRAAR